MFEEEEKDGVAVGRVLLPLNDQCHLDSKDYVTVWNVLRGKGVVVVGGGNKETSTGQFGATSTSGRHVNASI